MRRGTLPPASTAPFMEVRLAPASCEAVRAIRTKLAGARLNPSCTSSVTGAARVPAALFCVQSMKPDTAPVFFDPSGRRAGRVRSAAWVVAALTVLLLLGFGASLLIAPQILPLQAQHRVANARLAGLSVHHIKTRPLQIQVRDAPRRPPMPANQ